LLRCLRCSVYDYVVPTLLFDLFDSLRLFVPRSVGLRPLLVVCWLRCYVTLVTFPFGCLNLAFVWLFVVVALLLRWVGCSVRYIHFVSLLIVVVVYDVVVLFVVVVTLFCSLLRCCCCSLLLPLLRYVVVYVDFVVPVVAVVPFRCCSALLLLLLLL
jgi:hypothetical protein